MFASSYHIPYQTCPPTFVLVEKVYTDGNVAAMGLVVPESAGFGWIVVVFAERHRKLRCYNFRSKGYFADRHLEGNNCWVALTSALAVSELASSTVRVVAYAIEAAPMMMLLLPC